MDYADPGLRPGLSQRGLTGLKTYLTEVGLFLKAGAAAARWQRGRF